MKGTDRAAGQVGAGAAEVYEQCFVPALFGQWAVPLLDAAGVGQGDRALDVGCGTGVVTRAAAARIGPTGEAVGLDRNDAMLAVARRTSTQVTWRQGQAENLPFPAGRFDRVVCPFVLMFVDDRAQALREMARVLVPGGTVAVATWAAIECCPAYATMLDVLRRVVGDAAADALSVPFCLGSVDAVADVMAPAFPDVTVARHEGTARFDSIEQWVHTDIRGWTLAGMVDDEAYARILSEAKDRLSRYTDDAGHVAFSAPAIVAAASKSSS